ncbi:MAG: hypothetical protein II969_05720 [Anaerolineaceae bacterium]|nr:hypothetical protein [Anaerolineaceae bacterium]
MKKSGKEILLRVVILIVGLTIAHLGVTLFLLANLGTDPFNVLIQGLHRLIGNPQITHGTIHICICSLIILILLFVDRSYIGIGTIICMFCGGPIIDFFTLLLGPLFAGEISLVIRIAVNILGCVILAFGMTIVIKSEAGTGPNDLVAVVLSDKLKKPFGIVRVIVDLLFTGIGYALGGTVGIGTIICAFFVGPVANFFFPPVEKTVKTLTAKFNATAQNESK